VGDCGCRKKDIEVGGEGWRGVAVRSSRALRDTILLGYGCLSGVYKLRTRGATLTSHQDSLEASRGFIRNTVPVSYYTILYI